MDRLRGDRPVPTRLRGAVVALGNFDGFHVGHQAVVRRALERARAEGRPAMIVTFDPHPARLFRPEMPPFLLTTMPQRMGLFERFGIDGALALPFDRALAALSPQAFFEEWLIGRIGAAALVTGEDFTFGRDRAADTDALAAMARAHGMTAEMVAPVLADGAVASSTRVRQHLREGAMDAAARLLTRPFAIEGVVEHGAKLGRSIGYPTANIRLGEYQRPRYGVYAVRGRLAGGRVLEGAANLGIRPSFDPPAELLEPTFFDFAGDLYGQTIAVELIAHLRDEARYDSLGALTAQIAADCEQARHILAGTGLSL